MRLIGPFLISCLVALCAQATPLRAARRTSPLHLDGKVDEPAWQAAPVFDDFVESYPVQGGRPSQRTEVRFLYDDDNLYVAFVCHDTEPSKIVATLDRRDNIPSTSDYVQVAIDSSHDGRTALAFAINAAGVMRDQLYYDDTSSNSSWDAVWDGRASVNADGWSAELVIPLSVLHFPNVEEQRWGFEAQRYIPRTHEQLDSVLLPRSANARVSRYGILDGLTHLSPKPGLEVRPYVAARGTERPRFDAADRAHPRIFDPSLDFGLDLRAALTSRITLNAAVNPDFGEVEPDALVLNLGNNEVFYSEKRTFFTQGLELFEPLSAGVNGGASGITPFYSRRIGLAAPILGAAKVVGGVGDDFKVGLLEAVVLGEQDDAKAKLAFAGQDTDNAPLDRTVQFHPSTPFHIGPNDELPAQRAASMNYFAAVARQKLAGNSAVSATFTSAVPVGALCYRSDFVDPTAYSEDGCAAQGGNGLALETSLATGDGNWGAKSMLNLSQVVGGPQTVRRRTGVDLHPGDLGSAAFVKVGKFGGEPWQFNAWYLYNSPKLELNPMGYQPYDDIHEVGLYGGYVRPEGVGSLHDFQLSSTAYADFSSDGKRTPRGARWQGDIGWNFPNYFFLSFGVGWENNQYDIKEIEDTGIPFQRRGDVYVATSFNSDPNRPFSFSGGGDVFKTSGTGPVPSEIGEGVNGGVSWRPMSALMTSLSANWNRNPQGARFVDDLGGGHYVFAAQYPAYVSVTLRASWIFDPRLSLQVYSQLFSAYGHYGPFFQAESRDGSPVTLNSLTPLSGYSGNPDFHVSALTANAVLRWEWHPGSTLFLVYSRSQDEVPFGAGRSVVTLLPNALGQGRTTETLMAKFSYWWDV